MILENLFKKAFPSFTDRETGSVIIFLLMLIFIGLVVVLGMSQLALTRTQEVRYEDYSLRAYYAAEAGIEQAIPELSALNGLSGSNLEAYLKSPSSGLQTDGPQAVGDSGATFERIISRQTVPAIIHPIEANQTAEFDLSDMEGFTLENSDINLTWRDESCLDGFCEGALEAILVWEIGGAQNQLYNPSLEATWENMPATEPEKSWTAIDEGQLFSTDQEAFHGDKSIRLSLENPSVDSNLGLTRSLDNLIELEPNSDYTLSAYVLIDQLGAGSKVSISLHGYSDVRRGVLARLNIFDKKEIDHTTRGQWERIHVSFKTPDQKIFLRPFFHLEKGSRGIWYLDAIQLEQNPYPTEYCQGLFHGCSWVADDANFPPPFQGSIRSSSAYRSERYFFDARRQAKNSLYTVSENWNSVDSQVELKIPIREASYNRVLRLKSYFSPMEVELSASNIDGGLMLPEQAIEIRSTGHFQNTSKALSIKIGLPTVFPTLDYVLYNHGCVDGDCFPRDLIK